jgi:uncharacterized protein (DUF2225 family)
MIPGPTIIIECPYCGQYAKKRTIISGNTFGAKLWSDGKRITPMLPEFPSLVVCKKCGQFYMVKDAKKVDEVAAFSENNDKWRNIDYIEFPTFHQYFKALGSIKDEKFIRISIWWSFNDYFRESHENDITPVMQNLNTENLYALLKILDEAKKDELLMKAEVLRNLEQFEESRQLLSRINNAELNWVKDKFLVEINNQNKQVFQLY